MKVAVFGGSFNPPHVGHGMVASWLLWTGQAERVILMPTADHPFAKALQPYELRVRWCEAFARQLGPGVSVSTLEGERKGPSYTFDTLELLSERHPKDTFRPVLGADLIDGTSRWHRWEELEAKYPPIFVGRQGYPSLPMAPTFPKVSSTHIRTLLKQGQSVDGWVFSGVLPLLVEADWS